MSDRSEVEMAKKIAMALENAAFRGLITDWNDLGEVTIQSDGRTYRMMVRDITDEG
jgi:hypothetical protein